MYTLAAFVAYAVVIGILYTVRGRLSAFLSTTVFLALTLLYLANGFDPALPGSIVKMFGGATVVAVLIYVTSSEAGREAYWGPIRTMIIERRPVLYVALLVIPALAAWRSYAAALPNDVAPPMVRTVHPAPPSSIPVNAPGATEPVNVDLVKGHNPLRQLETSNPAAFAAKVARGKAVYYQNCFFCHGDHLAADGHYAKAMRPLPATFQDPSVLPLFQETFFFWRIAKGGPGLPAGATPWDSVMPVWENILSADDMWSAILFLYDHTGYRPRGQQVQGEGH